MFCRNAAYRTGRTKSSDMTHQALCCTVAGGVALLFAAAPAIAAGCAFESLGEGRVAAVIDARSFRLDDGREVRLAGIEPAIPDKTKAMAALSAIVMGRDVTLHGEDDAPDRYGR